MSLIKQLLKVSVASILLAGTVSVDAAQTVQQYSIDDLMNDTLLSKEITVLVQVNRISGKDTQGQRQVLYEDKAGMLVDLDLMTAAVQRLDGRLIAVGVYEDIQLELSNDAHLSGPNSLMLRAPISEHGDTVIIKAQGVIQVSPAREVTSRINIEMHEFSRPLQPALVRALLAATPARGCDVSAVC
ncbi:MAG: hypothetical protein ABFS39_02020 [Pseudomonadota bacterium]